MALPSTFKIEIEDESLVWQDVTLSVVNLTDGTTSRSQIIPTVAISFGIDADSVLQYLDETVNPDRARIRITENTTVKYYLMEKGNGQVSQGYDYPTTTGRAFAGRIVDFPLANFVNVSNQPMSAIARQMCVSNIDEQSGDFISLLWGATQDPTVPAKRLEFNREDRLSLIRNMAESCGAGVRVSLDGLGFEVYDIPSKALTDSASFDYECALSLSYDVQRVNKPFNALRLKGAAFEYSVGVDPKLTVFISPDSIVADGVTTAQASAQVHDTTGAPVQHSLIVDEAIDADSTTVIPVSGCFAVTAVWVNSGTQSVPVKSTRIDYTTFDASTITVPVQASDLFIVSYTQAESVSWAIEDYADNVDGEAQNTTGTLAVSTTNNIGQVVGVYLTTDTRRIGTNFYTGGSFTENTKDIVLGISPGASGTSVLIDYVKYNASPLTGVNVSPTSSLCDSDGIASTVVGSGTDIGAGLVVAESLGQQGLARLSLTGSDVGALSLTADPAIIRRSVEDFKIESNFTGESTVTAVDGSQYYALVDNPIVYGTSIAVAGYPAAYVLSWNNSAPNYKIVIGGATPPATTVATVTYSGYEIISEEDKTSEITAIVLDSSGSPVTDGTVVYFELSNYSLNCTLSAVSATTTDGVASVNLNAGNQSGVVVVSAIAGGYHADINVTITDEDISGGASTANGASGGWGKVSTTRNDRSDATENCVPVANDSNSSDGSVSGSRRLVGCDGKPLDNEKITLDNGVVVATNADGIFQFTSGSTGSNAITVGGNSYSFEVSPQNSGSRSGFRNVCANGDGEATYEG